MGLTNVNRDRPILITGKTGTGKTTMAKEILPEAKVVYGNSCDINDLGSHSTRHGIIIEDVNYKPQKDNILYILRNYKGKIILTSLLEKDVPREIKNMCKIKRAGSNQHLRETIKQLAPHSDNPFSYEKDTFSLVREYLKESDRDLIKDLLMYNKPSDTQILSWLSENMHPNKLLFIDGVVKRRWPQHYFYELLAYAHSGNSFGRLTMPKRKSYSKKPYLIRKLGIKNGEERIFNQLMKDSEFIKYARDKLNNTDSRILGLGEKPKKKAKPKIKSPSLEDFM